MRHISPKTFSVVDGQEFDVNDFNDFNGGTRRGSVATWMAEHLSENGVIVWDNSDRMDYREGLAELETLGFGRLSFFGLGPVNAYAFETSIFSRDIKSPSWQLPIKNTIKYQANVHNDAAWFLVI